MPSRGASAHGNAGRQQRGVKLVNNNVDRQQIATYTKMNMAGFTKLFSSILDSTIWREDDKTRIVWITMLAMADRLGYVAASIPGLAARANVSIPEVKAALAKLADVDEYSRTKDNDGRRIEDADGGWNLLNYAKYRELGRSVDRVEYLRIKKRESRARSTNVNQGQPISEAEAEAEKKNPADSIFPVSLQTPAFTEAWAEWEKLRKESKKKLTPESIKKQLGDLEKMGEAIAIQSINESIKNGWQGLFQPKQQNGKTYTNSKSVTASSANAGTSNAAQARRY